MAPLVVQVKVPVDGVTKSTLEAEVTAIGAASFTSGSTIVILPPVKAKLEVSILQDDPP